MAGSPFLAFLALILLAGGILLNIFIILSGTGIYVVPISKIFFISVTPPSGTTSVWTYFSLCALTGSDYHNCGSIHPAYPFQPRTQLPSGSSVPAALNTNFYYYMSRVSWSFYLIATFFAATTLFFGIFACCARFASVFSGFMSFLAMASQAVCAALMTAWTVKARQILQANGYGSDLGRYGYGFTWAAFVCFFLSMLFFCCGGGRKKETTEEEVIPVDPATGHPVEQHQQPATNAGFFGRKSSQKSRETGVKDEYS